MHEKLHANKVKILEILKKYMSESIPRLSEDEDFLEEMLLKFKLKASE